MGSRGYKVKSKEAIILQPDKVTKVPVSVNFPPNATCLYVERSELRNRNTEAFFGAPDSFIQSDDPFLQVANFTDHPVLLQKGRFLGWAHDPTTWLDSTDNCNNEEVQALQAHAAAIQVIVNDWCDSLDG